jgi:hypothetical protein
MARGAAKKLPNDGTIERGVHAILARYESLAIRQIEWDTFCMACIEHISNMNPQLGWGRNYGRNRDAMNRLRRVISREVKANPVWLKGAMTVKRPAIFIDALGAENHEMINHQVPSLRYIGGVVNG